MAFPEVSRGERGGDYKEVNDQVITSTNGIRTIRDNRRHLRNCRSDSPQLT